MVDRERRAAAFTIAGAALCAAVLAASQPRPLSTFVTGGERTHVVEPGESLALIASREGIDGTVLARRNGNEPGARLIPGTPLIIDNLHVVPHAEAGISLVVNVPQRMLFLFDNAGRPLAAHPVGVGRASWPTPTGDFRVLVKEQNPTWDVPISIQEEMRRAGKPVVTTVAPGPQNPLGRRWIGLSIPSLGIHGTSQPTSVYGYVSHGCIRMLADHVAVVFEQVTLGARGRVVYEPVLMARTADGIFLEAHRDIYRRRPEDPRASLLGSAVAAGWAGDIDWAAVDHVLRTQEGIATSVLRH